MADDEILISGLPAVASAELADLFIVLRSGLARHLTGQQVVDLVIAQLTATAPAALDTWLELVAQIEGNESGLAAVVAALADKADDAATTAALAGKLAADALIGQVSWFAMDSAPTGFLKCNGAAVSRTTYAPLYAKIGTLHGAGDGSTTFNLPDLRGEFVRGWDDGRGIDAARVFGSAQADAFKSHNHDLPSAMGRFTGGGTVGGGGSVVVVSDYSTSSSGGTETRPRNVALLACIKY